MHIVSMSTRDDNNAALRRWASCSPLNDIVNSNGAILLPTIYPTRAGGGGRGLWASNLSTTEGVDGDTGFFDDTMHNS